MTAAAVTAAELPEVPTEVAGAEVAVRAEAMVGSEAMVGPEVAVRAEAMVGSDAMVGPEVAVGPEAMVGSEAMVGPEVAVGPEAMVGSEAMAGAEAAAKTHHRCCVACHGTGRLPLRRRKSRRGVGADDGGQEQAPPSGTPSHALSPLWAPPLGVSCTACGTACVHTCIRTCIHL